MPDQAANNDDLAGMSTLALEPVVRDWIHITADNYAVEEGDDSDDVSSLDMTPATLAKHVESDLKIESCARAQHATKTLFTKFPVRNEPHMCTAFRRGVHRWLQDCGSGSPRHISASTSPTYADGGATFELTGPAFPTSKHQLSRPRMLAEPRQSRRVAPDVVCGYSTQEQPQAQMNPLLPQRGHPVRYGELDGGLMRGQNTVPHPVLPAYQPTVLWDCRLAHNGLHPSAHEVRFDPQTWGVHMPQLGRVQPPDTTQSLSMEWRVPPNAQPMDCQAGFGKSHFRPTFGTLPHPQPCNMMITSRPNLGVGPLHNTVAYPQQSLPPTRYDAMCGTQVGNAPALES